MTASLFSPIRLRGLTLANRVIIAPMCQYSAEDGKVTDWHLIHLGGLAMSGSGLLFLEAAAVEPRGRITHGCIGLYSDEAEVALTRVVRACQEHGNTPLAIQLGHAGRKASCHPPRTGGKPLKDGEGAWETIGPSALPFDADWHTPREMDRALMDEVIAAHIQAVERSDRIGFVAVELHAAHGYLISEFLSPLANHRTDEYGGSLENRMRFPLELFAAMRAAWPDDKPMGVRFNGTDWDDAGLTTEDAVAFAQALKAAGCDFFDVSGGGNSMVRPPVGPGYQADLAAAVKQATGVPTMAVGMIRDPKLAQDLLDRGACDMVALARGFLYEPRWTWRAAYELGAEADYPEQVQRGNPLLWPQAFEGDAPSTGVDDDGWEVGAAPHIMVPKKKRGR